MSQPEFLPDVLMYTGVSMIVLSFMGYFGAKQESKIGLLTYSGLASVLVVNMIIFTSLITLGAQVMRQSSEEQCLLSMPSFNRDFIKESIGCSHKYASNSTDAMSLTCPKEEISQIWESNIDIDYLEQNEIYGCLNVNCCAPMLAFIKSKFDFLAAFCIVSILFLLTAVMCTLYMYRKTRRYPT